MKLEDRLKQQLAELQREYQEKAKPIVDQLVRIESLKPPAPIVIPMGLADPDGIFDRIATRIFEAKANTKAKAVAICINEAGLDALCRDDRISQQGGNRANIAQQTFHGLPFKVLADRPGDKFPDHWRFYLEYRQNDA